jgi:cytochrome b
MPPPAPLVWDPVVRILHWSLVAAFAAELGPVAPQGALHRWLGGAIVVLVMARLLWGVVGSRAARFGAFPPSLGMALVHLWEIGRGVVRRQDSHDPLGALMVYNLLATLAGLGLSGWLRTIAPDWPGAGALHRGLVLWALVSVALHIGGVIFESRRTGRNLVRGMWRGYAAAKPQDAPCPDPDPTAAATSCSRSSFSRRSAPASSSPMRWQMRWTPTRGARTASRSSSSRPPRGWSWRSSSRSSS